jgi:hypothetical protein
MLAGRRFTGRVSGARVAGPESVRVAEMLARPSVPPLHPAADRDLA